MTALCYQSIETPDIPVVGSLPTASTISIVTNVSLINNYNWVAGANVVSGYNRIGLASENAFVTRPAPWNSSENIVVWKTSPSGDNGPDGGWNTEEFNIDNTKLYRFSVWVKRVSNQTGGTFYLGMYDNSPQELGQGPRRTIDNATTELPLDNPNYYPGYQNPYWECSGISRFDLDQWYLVVGHVYPHDTTYTGRHPDTGIYTTSGYKVMDITGCNIGDGDIKWGSLATKGIHRTYHFYTPDAFSSLEFAGPRVDLIDDDIPGIPTITDLLESNGQRYANTFFTGNVILGLTSGANGTVTNVSLTESLANISYIPNNETKFIPGERIITPQPEIIFYSEGTNVVPYISNWNNSNVQYMDSFAGQANVTAHASTGGIRYVTIEVTSTGYWTCPANVFEIQLAVVGGGGAGGADNGGGGGGGAVLYAPTFKTTPGKTYPIVIGAGGVGTASDKLKGSDGSSTLFDNLVALGGGAGGSGYLDVGSGNSLGNGGGAAGDDANAVPGTFSTEFTTVKTQVEALGYNYYGGYSGGTVLRNGGGGGGGAGGNGQDPVFTTITTPHLVTFVTPGVLTAGYGTNTSITFSTPEYIIKDEEILVRYDNLDNAPLQASTNTKRIRIASAGLNSSRTSERGIRYVNADGSLGSFIKQSPRSYTVSVFNRGDMDFSSHVSYDIFGDSTGATRTAMANYLNSLGSDVIVFIHTHDEPKNNRLGGGLETAMKRCGASSTIFEDEGLFKYRGAYTLVGIPGIGEGNGYEQYKGPANSSTESFCTMDIFVQDGNIIGEIVTASSTISGTGVLTISHDVRLASTGNANVYPLYTKVGGLGGLGVSIPYSSGRYYLAGGGSGGNENNFLANIYATPSVGYGAGSGGVSANINPSMNATPNRGGGGGGSAATALAGVGYQAGAGGSGVVLIQYVVPEEFKLTKNNLPTHAELKYKVDIHVVDSYDGEKISLFTSDNLNAANLQHLQTGSYNTLPNTVNYNKTTSTRYSNLYYSYSPWAANLQYDGYVSIDTGWEKHSNTSFFAIHNSGLNQSRADEALYLSNVQILLKNYTPTGIMKTNVARIDEGNVVSYNNVYYRYNGTQYIRVEDPYLLIYYDAANANSYVNGTIIRDLSGCNNDGTIVGYNANTVIDLGSNKAIKVSNDTASGRAGTKIDFKANELTSDVITVEMWAYVKAFDNGMFFGFQTHDVWTRSGALGFNTGQGDCYGISPAKVTELQLAENWHHYMFVMHKGDYTLNKIYINGVSQILSQQNASQKNDLTNFNSGVGRIGGWFTGTNSNNTYNISMLLNQFKLYNREITAKEAQRVFESKGESFGKALPKTQTFYSGIAVTANSIVFVDTLGSVNTVESGTPIKLSNTYGLVGVSTDKTYYTYGSNSSGFYITDTYCNAIAEPPIPLSNVTGIFLGLGVMDITGDFIIPYIGVQSNLLVSISANDTANVIQDASGIITWKDTSNNRFDFNVVGSPAFSRHIGNAEIFVNGRLTSDHAFIINSEL